MMYVRCEAVTFNNGERNVMVTFFFKHGVVGHVNILCHHLCYIVEQLTFLYTV